MLTMKKVKRVFVPVDTSTNAYMELRKSKPLGGRFMELLNKTFSRLRSKTPTRL